MSLAPENDKGSAKSSAKEPVEISFDSIRYCKRGHGMLPKDNRCPECSKGGWLTSPLAYVLYGFAAAAISMFYIPFDSSLTKLPAVGGYIFIFFPQTAVAWGLLMAIIEQKFRNKEVLHYRPPVKGAYRRALDCNVCGEHLNREGWCEGCSRKRTQPLIQLLIVLLPLFGVTSCFAGLLIVSNSPMAALFITILALPPILTAASRYRKTLPQK